MTDTPSQSDSRTPFQKFQDGLRLGLSAPKEEVKKSMEEEAAKRKKTAVKSK